MKANLLMIENSRIRQLHEMCVKLIKWRKELLTITMADYGKGLLLEENPT
jgi:hypothetical protein